MDNKFTTKEEYLEYRANWKLLYKVISRNIRLYKFCCWYESLGNKRKTPALTEKYESYEKWHGYPRWRIILINKPEATKMLKELKEAKIEAQKQYLESKKESVTII